MSKLHSNKLQTVELAELQVDNTSPEVKFIASTLLEIETLVPLLQKLKEKQKINVLYGIPLVPSHIPRLAALASDLGHESITVMIDHPDQVQFLSKFSEIAKFPACVFVKVDTGYHRAGLPPISLNKNGLLEKLAEAEKAGHARLLGLYSHSSLSYGAKTADEAISYTISEIEGCKDALTRWLHLLPDREIVISIGATPQAVSSHNLVEEETKSSKAEELKSLLSAPADSKFKIELHAGNYPVLDMQQVSTHARVSAGTLEEEIAMTVVAEVCSVYNDGEREKPEALLAAGTLALGREPCASYPGWGVLSTWRQSGVKEGARLFVDRISQEHAIVAWDSRGEEKIPLKIGQVAKIFPNHSCVTGAFYGFYFIVDSDSDPDASKIVDVWVRGRGSHVTDHLLVNRSQ